MKIHWALLCFKSIIDADTKSISLIDVFDQLTIGEKPAGPAMVPFPFEIVALCERSEPSVSEKAQGRIVFVDPKGGSHGTSAPFEVDLDSTPRNRIRLHMPGLLVVDPGSYLVTIEAMNKKNEWTRAVSTLLEVSVGVSAGPAVAMQALS